MGPDGRRYEHRVHTQQQASSLDTCDVNAALARQGRPPDGCLQGFTVSVCATKIRRSYFEMNLRLEDIPQAAQGRQEVGVCEDLNGLELNVAYRAFDL